MRKSAITIGLIGAAAISAVGAIGYATVTRNQDSAVASKSIHQPKPLPMLAAAPPAADIPRLKQAAAARRSDAAGWNRLGQGLLGASRYDEAVDAYRTSLAIDATQAPIWSSLGEAYVHALPSTTSKMPAEARAAFDHALALDKNDLRARFYLALEKDYDGQHDAAVGDWLTMLRGVPRGSTADQAIREALLASLNRHIRLVSNAVERSGQLQPRNGAAPAKS